MLSTTRIAALLCAVVLPVHAAAQNSTAHLSVERFTHDAVSDGRNAYFVGGALSGPPVIDVYHGDTGQWSTLPLSVERWNPSAVVAGTKLVIASGTPAGGSAPAGLIEIHDLQTGVLTFADLSLPRTNVAATAVGTLAIFAGGDTGLVHPTEFATSTTPPRGS